MMNDEELRKIKIRAKLAVEDQGGGVTIALAMDPVVVFALAAELLRLRQLQRDLEHAVEADHERLD